jgi:hypothetical protein
MNTNNNRSKKVNDIVQDINEEEEDFWDKVGSIFNPFKCGK